MNKSMGQLAVIPQLAQFITRWPLSKVLLSFHKCSSGFFRAFTPHYLLSNIGGALNPKPLLSNIGGGVTIQGKRLTLASLLPAAWNR